MFMPNLYIYIYSLNKTQIYLPCDFEDSKVCFSSPFSRKIQNLKPWPQLDVRSTMEFQMLEFHHLQNLPW